MASSVRSDQISTAVRCLDSGSLPIPVRQRVQMRFPSVVRCPIYPFLFLYKPLRKMIHRLASLLLLCLFYVVSATTSTYSTYPSCAAGWEWANDAQGS